VSELEDRAARRAERLVRCYSPTWSQRYGEEFAELLAADMLERPRDWRRVLDVLRCGALSRFTAAGLAGEIADPMAQARAALVSFGVALAAFVPFGLAMWSQLTIGWQWSEPSVPVTGLAVVVMSVAVAVLALIAVLAAAPIVWVFLRRIVGRQQRGLLLPAALFSVGLTLLVLGGRHFGNGWPGTGGHPWAHQGLVPGGVAAFTWATTLGVTSYWAHPAALLAFPPAEVAWMGASPLAMVAVVVGAVQTVRRLDCSARVLRHEARVARLAGAAMAAFLVAAAAWVVDGGPGPRNLFHAGSIDVLGLVVMGSALAVGLRALHRVRPRRLDRAPG